MSPFIAKTLSFLAPILQQKAMKKLAEPLTERKTEEASEGSTRPHAGQVSTQLAKVGLGATIATLTQVESVEATVATIAVLLVNLVFLYFPDLSPKK